MHYHDSRKSGGKTERGVRNNAGESPCVDRAYGDGVGSQALAVKAGEKRRAGRQNVGRDVKERYA